MSDGVIQRILDATNGGLDIILWLCPEAEKCISNNRHFKLRASEKTASASVKKMPSGVYYITDFGGDFKGSAVNLYCYLYNKDIKTAIKELGSKYNCLDGGRKFETVKPVYKKRPANEIEPEGHYETQIRDTFTETELQTIFSQKVIDRVCQLHHTKWKDHLQNVCKSLGCAAVISFSYVKDGEYRTTEATDQYPIFCFTGNEFKKIYQPLADKKFRFRTFGTQDKNYIWGLARVRKTFEDLQKGWEQQDEPEDDAKSSRKPPALDEVIICSGNGDALNVAALGYHAIWQNSESAILPGKVYGELQKMAKDVYNLPDIDTTGLREAHKMALRFLDLKTIQLPAELREKKDRRGNPCKDLRDYLNHYDHKAFDQLVKCALEYKFWDEDPQYNKNGDFKRMNYVFNNVRAYNFISKCGFHRLKSKSAKNGYEYIQVRGNVVKIIDVRDVKAFVNGFLEERFTEDQRLRNTFYRMNQLKDESLDNLKYVEPDFKYYDKDHQHLFFQNETWKVAATGIEVYRPGEIQKMVWEEKVIKHNARLLDPAWRVITNTATDGTEQLDIEIMRQDCLFFNYLVNTSRVHWRHELEDVLEEKHTTEKDREEYRKAHRFNIAGPLLSSDEQMEQKQHLINKLYVLGYTLARHKEKSKPWAPFLMDHKLSAEGESHGGSGKTIFARSVEPFMNFLLIDGKSKSLTDDKHSFENVTEQTEVILIDDLSRYTNIEPFFSMITEGITVNPKYTQRFVLPYEVAPKIIFTSNFGVKDVGPSAERRLIYGVFSDYYHDNSTGNYRESRTPADDFGKDLFTGFSEEEWNHFINTMALALQFYLSHDSKVSPPMDNVMRRNLQGVMGDVFKDWADVYFSDKCDQLISRPEAFQDFMRVANQKWGSPQRFIHAVEAWCKYYRYVFNPVELRNNRDRIIKKMPAKKPDGSVLTEFRKQADGQMKEVVVTKATEMIYIKTKDGEIDVTAVGGENDQPTPPAAPTLSLNDVNDLPF